MTIRASNDRRARHILMDNQERIRPHVLCHISLMYVEHWQRMASLTHIDLDDACIACFRHVCVHCHQLLDHHVGVKCLFNSTKFRSALD